MKLLGGKRLEEMSPEERAGYEEAAFENQARTAYLDAVRLELVVERAHLATAVAHRDALEAVEVKDLAKDDRFEHVSELALARESAESLTQRVADINAEIKKAN